MVGDVPHKPDRIRQHHRNATAQRPLPRSRHKRREKTIVRVSTARSERIKQRRLTRVGVPDNTDSEVLSFACRHLAPLAGLNRLKLSLKFELALLHEPPVDFQLHFTRAASADAADDALEVAPHRLQARVRVFHLSQLNLQLRFRSGGTRRENVQDQLRPIQNLPQRLLLQICNLLGRKIMIKDDRRRVELLRQQLELLHLARPDIRCRNRPLNILVNLPGHPRPGLLRKTPQFPERITLVVS